MPDAPRMGRFDYRQQRATDLRRFPDGERSGSQPIGECLAVHIRRESNPKKAAPKFPGPR